MGAVRVAVALVTVVLILQAPRQVLQTLTSDRLLIVILLLATLSFAWSLDTFLSFRRGIALFLASLLGVYIASAYDLRGQARLYLFTITLILVGSVIFALVLPQYGVMTGTHAGRWNGVLSHKNVLGRVLAVYAVLLFYFSREITGVRWRWVWIGLAALTVVFTGSASAQMILIIFVLVFPLYRVLRTHPYLFVGLTIIGGLIALGGIVWFALNTVTVFAWFGRDATLTGRTQLWDASLQMIAARPWLGYGYTASFTLDSPIIRALIWQDAPHAHNGWLDVALDLGLVGVTLFTLHNLRSLWRGFAMLRATSDPIYGLVLVFVLVFLAGSITDTSPLILRDMLWIMYVSLTLRLAVQLNNPTQSRIGGI
jgi:exopolysaccharide production protein ExoQ